jgi:CubicO group peptidase (beta-lactamase class C family)
MEKRMRTSARLHRYGLLVFCLFALSTALAFAQQLPETSPEQVGISKERLARIRPLMEKEISQGRTAGAVAIIVRHGKVAYFETFGMADREAAKPMRKDSIFRIYSMTKAITAVAVMTLYEDGRFSLDDPVSKYLPEFADTKVATNGSPDHKLTITPAKRTLTIRDLLRHTSGIGYDGPRDETGASLYDKKGIQGLLRTGMTLDEFSRRMASVPLKREPGTAFEYSMSIDILGRLVEVVSGQPLDVYMSEHIFKPLQMNDTGFYVPKEKWDRLTTIYQFENGKLNRLADSAMQEGYRTKPDICMGGSGLASTATDYARFVLMLLNRGELDGVRILSPKTVELMTADHLGDLPRADQILASGYGMGLSVAVNLGPGKVGSVGTAGEFNWSGYAGTHWWADPKEQMVGVFMMQNFADDFTRPMLFKRLAYSAIVDSAK